MVRSSDKHSYMNIIELIYFSCRCLPIPKAAKDVLRQMLDFSLLKDPVFLIICLGEVFGFVGLFIPFVFITERAVAFGIPDTKAAFLLSVIGRLTVLVHSSTGRVEDRPTGRHFPLHST